MRAVLVLLSAVLTFALPTHRIAAAEPSESERWEKEIRALEELDKSTPDPENAILFVGSSSIRLWQDMPKAMAPYPVIRRGFGGAKFSDVSHYAERLIYPHQFRALVIFVGNDVSGSADDKTPEQVVEFVTAILKTVRAKFADTPVFLIEITPTRKRWQVWPKIQQVNSALEKYCSQEDNVYWIATADRYLNDEGQPREDLFRDDQLHQNADGYQLWAELIKSRLDEVLADK